MTGAPEPGAVGEGGKQVTTPCPALAALPGVRNLHSHLTLKDLGRTLCPLGSAGELVCAHRAPVAFTRNMRKLTQRVTHGFSKICSVPVKCLDNFKHVKNYPHF